MTSLDSNQQAAIQAVWSKLWSKKSPFYFPNVAAYGLPDRNIDPMPVIQIPATRPITLGASEDNSNIIIGLQFSNLQLTNLTGLHFGGQTLSEKLVFGMSASNLKLVGGFSFEISETPEFFDVFMTANSGGGKGDGDSDSDNIKLAKAHRSRLLESDNGRKLVNAYYDNNEAYNELFQKSNELRDLWQNYSTGPDGNQQTTSFFAQHTANALQEDNMNSVYVNHTSIDAEQPQDGKISEPTYYDKHSYYMSTYLQNLCYRVANYYKDNNIAADPVKEAQFRQAGDSISTFADTTSKLLYPNVNDSEAPEQAKGTSNLFTGNQVYEQVEQPTEEDVKFQSNIVALKANALATPLRVPASIRAVMDKAQRDSEGFDPSTTLDEIQPIWQTLYGGDCIINIDAIQLEIAGTAETDAPYTIAITHISGATTALDINYDTDHLQEDTDNIPLKQRALNLAQQAISMNRMLQVLILHAINISDFRDWLSALLNAALADSTPE